MRLPALVLVLLLVMTSGADAQRGRLACASDEATCADGSCVRKSVVCDGVTDCPDGSDEYSCSQSGCQPNELRCRNNRCVMKHWRCDGDNDCGDNTDEENCGDGVAGSECRASEFQCASDTPSGQQCVPRTFQCDGRADCLDGSDEVGCAAPVIIEPPPAVLVISVGDVFIIQCRAVGQPTPEISWRRNWNHVPSKCRQESENGRGILTCPNASEADQGAYSCEAINAKGVVFSIPDTNVVVTNGGLCQPPDFNNAALTNDDCQRCFCFGATDNCYSSSLSVTELPAPDPRNVVIWSVDTLYPGWSITTTRERAYPGASGEILARPSPVFDGALYFGLPDSHSGRQLNSYGGYIRFQMSPTPDDEFPEVVIKGNSLTMWYRADVKPSNGFYDIKITEGNFFLVTRGRDDVVASREDIMMVLENIDAFLIRAYPAPDSGRAMISSVRVDTATATETSRGPAALVEHCRCPPGYTGLSCEDCAPGYQREPGGRWLGRCVQPPAECRPGEYGDPRRGIPCRPCPCPGPQYQFGRTCYLDADDQVTCNCDPGHVGRRCQKCAPGYRGQPTRGQPCVKGGECNPVGSLTDDPDPRTGLCECKEFVTGRRCDRCVARAFHLSEENQHGCINCFCMGVTDQCSSSDWHRRQESAVFTSESHGVTMADYLGETEYDGVSVDLASRQLVFKQLDRGTGGPLYWDLPARFLGDKVTSYGGFLRFTQSYSSDGQGQTYGQYPDIEIFGNDVRLMHVTAGGVPANAATRLEVPIREQAWRRDDGGPVDREHLLMALADLDYIIIKAANSPAATQAMLANVELDVASPRPTGQERAYAVEQCICPPGYRGLSCEDCDVGYTRSLSGLYLRQCVQCECGGRSDECDAETGECLNCRENTAGQRCELCLPGYTGDPSRGLPCRPGPSRQCSCDPRGSLTAECDSRLQCACKANVQGDRCDRCQPGSFGLGTDPNEGCSRCYCSGVSQQCSVAPVYRTQLPMQVVDEEHGFSVANRDGDVVVASEQVDDFSAADNEVGFHLEAAELGTPLYWSLPDLFTGDKLASYGGTLTVRQRMELDPALRSAAPDDHPEIVIVGGGAQIEWQNPAPPQTDGRPGSYSVQLSPEAGWRDGQTGAAVTRELLMQVLAEVDALLVRATPPAAAGPAAAAEGLEPLYTHISNVVLDTAIPTYTLQGRVEEVEQCRCPPEYQGLSCQDCAAGHYRDAEDACRRCPCSGHEQSCALADDGTVLCTCRPNFSGETCEIEGDEPLVPPRVSITPRYLQLRAGDQAQFDCEAEGIPAPALTWSGGRGGVLQSDVNVIGGVLLISAVRKEHEAEYTCTATNSAGTDAKRTVIYVTESGRVPPPPPLGRIDPNSALVQAGETVRLACRSARPDAGVFWSRGEGRQLPQSASEEAGVLTIKDAQSVDAGVYVCTIVDSAGQRREELEARVEVRVAGPTPVLNIKPDRQTVRQGDTVELQCLTSDGESPRWSRPGQPLPDSAQQVGGSLILRDVTTAERGVYVCTAGRLQASAVVDVQPLEPPRLEIYPSEAQQVSVGGSVLFQCRVTAGDPAPQLTWTRADGGQLPRTAQILPGGVIRFIRVTGDEEGEYVCTASNTAGEATATARLEVLVPPVVVIDHPSLLRVLEGDPLELRCSASGKPAPSVFWSGGADWSGASGRPGYTQLDFATTPLTAAGVYVCSAESEAGRTAERIRLVVEPAAGARGGGGGGGDGGGSGGGGVGGGGGGRPPVTAGGVHPSEEVYVVPLSGRAELTCLVEGSNRDISIAWIRSDGLPMPSDHVIRGGTLYINDVKKNDEGTYTCLGLGPSEVVLFQADATLKVIEPPRVQLDPVRQVVQPGQTVSIDCSVTGDQPVVVRWDRVDGQLPDTVSVIDGVLTFGGIAVSDEGRYVCSAENSAGQAQGVAEVIVSEGARIVAFDRDVVAYVGSSVALRCDSSGFNGRISWSREDQPLPDSAVSDDSTLRLTDVDESASGVYICAIQDQYGRRQQDIIRLTVQPGASQTEGATCAPDEFPCMSGECLSIAAFCDGQPDCADASDEARCELQYDAAAAGADADAAPAEAEEEVAKE